MPWEAVIGIEVHVQLATRSKLFSGASTRFGAAPNSQACAVDLALPGTLPTLNAEAVRMAVMFGLAIDAEIARYAQFDRKQYFYPDLPKGYQISQLHRPIVGPGRIEAPMNGGAKTVRISRAHLEEDAGKLLHDRWPGQSGVDLNRAGVPLLEIVSEPDMRSAAEATAYLRHIHQLVRFIGISDGDMSQGSMRCDINISLRPAGVEALGKRAEIKNVNSFRFAAKAIDGEIARQGRLLDQGMPVRQETRLYDAENDRTQAMRSKEQAPDYRYFPDPDLLPLRIDDAYIDAVRAAMPELPAAMRRRFRERYRLDAGSVDAVLDSPASAAYFEQLAERCGDARLAANWVTGELAAALKQRRTSIARSPVSAESLGGLLRRVADGEITGPIAKTVFSALCAGEEGGDVDAIIAKRGLKPVFDPEAVERLVRETLDAHPEETTRYAALAGAKRKKLRGFLAGQVMKASRGSADPKAVDERLRRALDSLGDSSAEPPASS